MKSLLTLLKIRSMSIISCPVCGEYISNEVKKCPFCGAQVRAK
ncbi:zinc-ribbon domain-containing protein [Serpentinicella alkaliphila]|uniref:Zinc ribbon protein n=1 Tax=Serpentinicella alkaliphila TaxID=1734049 RepID=A0A4R2TVJ6_9FIRM|nr:zinc-ribbon domain-containing protein [Serpentinicella alkaliphila]QUH26788.1 hypothetical protein HZR23_14355 [Serpentinicella alkaliphila]TCQ08008.1 zinc ribbon protein [Serpentinicella alkaliphila]